MPSSSSWKAASNTSCRCSRKKTNSFRLRPAIFISRFSTSETLAAGCHRSIPIATSVAGVGSRGVQKIMAEWALSILCA
jgi:hypothetical protein